MKTPTPEQLTALIANAQGLVQLVNNDAPRLADSLTYRYLNDVLETITGESVRRTANCPHGEDLGTWCVECPGEVANIPDGVTLHPQDKTGGCWVVWFRGRLCSPFFNSKGAANAYLDALAAGTRQPEYVS